MLDLTACTDGELAALALGGRQTAYTELMNRHREFVFRISRSHTADHDAALDVTQQTFVSAFSALERYDGGRSFRHWIGRIAINKCHDWARRRKVRRFFTFALPIDDAQDIADDGVGAETAIADRQELRRTMAAIANLPARLKEVLVLRTIEDLSQAEAAEFLNISEKAVETRLYRARAKLLENLRE